MTLEDLRYLDHRTRSGHASFGQLSCALNPDGTAKASTFFVESPVHQEADFWLCTLRGEADNEDHFFGPTVAA